MSGGLVASDSKEPKSMAQDTRKDPRAKVLTMTVRYKSATLDEFIEHHSHDMSRGGMFIKTPSPFPPGTLLKFEVKIAEDKKVMQGVGRVVWKREPTEASESRPAGMGVKFIKIDDESRMLIDRLVTTRGDAGSAYESGSQTEALSQPPAAKAAPAPKAPAEAKPPVPQRKATMIGLGSVGLAEAAVPKAEKPSEPEQPFFPPTQSEADMPPPEERTVMKQAAELLEEALAQAGGSLTDVAAEPAEPAQAKIEAAPRPAPKPIGEQPPRSEPAAPNAEEAARAPSPRAAEAPARVDRPKPAAAAAPKPAEPRRAPAARVSPAVAPPAEKGGGGGKTALLVLAVAAVGGLIYFLTRHGAEPEVAPSATAETVAPVASPSPPPSVVPAEPKPAEPVVSAEPVAVDAAAEAAPDAGVKVEKVQPTTEPKPVVRRPPRGARPPTEATPPTEAPAAPPEATPPPKPAETAEPKPAPEPKPKPAPKPAKKGPDENPY
jgi:uncharacterized protein (TIGR02266 family)